MKICIIGTGRMGRRHIDAVRGLGLEVVGIFDPNREAMDIAVKDNGIKLEECYTDVNEMLKKLVPEGVVVSSTAPSHSEHVLAAAASGAKYILCEKPMGTSLEECDRMIKACSETDTVLGINHQMRFMEQYTSVKTLSSSEELGGLRSVTISASNFGLAMNASHYFEMFRFMTGENISEISFYSEKEKLSNPRGLQYSDLAGQLLARTKKGHRLYIELGGDLGHGVHVTYGCRYGQIFVDELGGYLRAVYRNPEYRDLPTSRYGMPCTEITKRIAPADVIAPTQAVWKAMLEKKNYPDGICGRHALAALVAAHVSSENEGRMIRINTDLPLSRKYSWA